MHDQRHKRQKCQTQRSRSLHGEIVPLALTFEAELNPCFLEGSLHSPAALEEASNLTDG